MKTRYLKHRKGSVILGSALFVLIMSFIVGNYLVFVSSGSLGVKKLNDSAKAFYLAEAGVQQTVWEINHQGPNSITQALGEGSYQATYSTANNSITSTGTVNGISRTVTVDIIGLPPGVKGAVTTHSNTSTTGNITIDGRDHYFWGGLNGAPGGLGLSTTGSYTQMGNSTVGGSGIAPSTPANPTTYEQNAPPSSTAPWDILGVSEAWYNANVPAASSPPEDFFGVVSYDPPGGIWNSADIGFSIGILIVHNSTNTATMKNIHGVLIGMLIVDNITHVNGDAYIIGAVVTANQTGNVLGNGNAYVAYSTQALSFVGAMLGNTVGWTKTPKSGSWRESP